MKTIKKYFKCLGGNFVCDLAFGFINSLFDQHDIVSIVIGSFILTTPVVFIPTTLDRTIHTDAISSQKIQYLLTGLEGLGISHYIYREGDFKYSLPINTTIKCLLTKYLLEDYGLEIQDETEHESSKQLESEDTATDYHLNAEFHQSAVENLLVLGL